MHAQNQLFDVIQPASQAEDTSQTYAQGFIAGSIGAGTLALWFLLLDLLKGHPLLTPTILETALFNHLSGPVDPETLISSVDAVDAVVGFTFIHWLVFALIGCVASRLLALAERNPNLGFGVLLLFIIFEGGFLAATTMLASPVLHSLAWPTVLLGNILAAMGMGLYFWYRHPHLPISP